MILSSIIIIRCYILPKRLFLKRQGLYYTRVVSLNKKEYAFAVYVLQRLGKPLKPIPDEWLNEIWLICLLLVNFMIKVYLESRLIFFDTDCVIKYDCVMKKR